MRPFRAAAVAAAGAALAALASPWLAAAARQPSQPNCGTTATAPQPQQRPQVTTVDLAGGGGVWRVANANGSIAVPAEVPGVIHMDLLRAGVIEEPYFRYGEINQTWVCMEPAWTWKRDLSAAAAAVANATAILLRFEGVDTVSEVRVGGTVVGATASMWHRPVFDVTGAIRAAPVAPVEGRGSDPSAAAPGLALEVAIKSPARESLARRDAYPAGVPGSFVTPFQFPGCNCSDGSGTRAESDASRCFLDPAWRSHCNDTADTRKFLRKSQAHFGWDWGGGFLTSGVYRNVSLVGVTGAMVQDVVVQTFAVAGARDALGLPSRFSVTVTAVLFATAGLDGAGLDIVTTLHGAENKTAVVAPPVHGEVTATLTLDVPLGNASAELWWPSGHGGQPLFTLTVSVVERSSGSAVHQWRRRVGFREVELVQQPVGNASDNGGGGSVGTRGGSDGGSGDSSSSSGGNNYAGGLSFFFRVNGRPIFAKGANWINADQFETRVSAAKMRWLVSSAASAKYNMLRVWGGGMWERDDFYSLCDELGLMVWEEGKFACSLYPVDRDFLASVETEYRDQVRRLSRHPSIVVYSGNNENQSPAQQQGLAQVVAYSQLYDGAVRASLAALDRSRPYWPASPSNGAVVDDPDAGVYEQRWGDEQDGSYGDSHQYPFFNTETDCEDVGLFKPTRFLSEYGFISMPNAATMREAVAPSDITADGNSTQLFFRMRQSWPHGQSILFSQLWRHADPPSGAANASDAFDDLCYLSQAVHAHCLTLASLSFRLQRSGPAGTAGLLFWSLNEQWQGQSDAAVDYSGRWKLLHHAAARFFAGAVVAAVQSRPGADIVVGAANDGAVALRGSVVVDVVSWRGGAVVRTDRRDGVVVPPFGSVNVSTTPLALFLGQHAATGVYLRTTFVGDKAAAPGTARAGDRGGLGANAAVSAAAASSSSAAVVPTDFHLVSKVKDAALQDPQIELSWSQAPGGDDAIAVTVACKNPAPFVSLGVGALRGRWTDDGFFCEPGTPRTVAYVRAPGEEGTVTLARVKAIVRVRTPWHVFSRVGERRR